MTHPNVLPLLGIAVDPLQLVSNWMSGGALLEYIESNPQTDRLGLVGAPPRVCPALTPVTSFQTSLGASLTYTLAM